MTTIRFRFSALVAALVLAFSLPALAQTTVPTTTTSTAVTATAQQITIASVGSGATILQVGSYLFIDWEQILVQSCGATTGSCTSTTIQVMRGVGGTRAAPHASGATVTYGVGAMFQITDPPLGSCALATVQYLPWINIRTGNQWMCDARTAGSGFEWFGVNIAPFAYGSTPQFRGN